MNFSPLDSLLQNYLPKKSTGDESHNFFCRSNPQGGVDIYRVDTTTKQVLCQGNLPHPI